MPNVRAEWQTEEQTLIRLLYEQSDQGLQLNIKGIYCNYHIILIMISDASISNLAQITELT